MPQCHQSPAGTSIGVRVQPLIGRETLLEQLAEMIGRPPAGHLVGPVGREDLARDGAGRTVGGRVRGRCPRRGIGRRRRRGRDGRSARDGHRRQPAEVELDRRCHRRSAAAPTKPAGARQLRAPDRARGRAGRRGSCSEAPTISIVATSREPLAVAGERLWTVNPLPTGPADLFGSDVVARRAGRDPAVALFVDSSQGRRSLLRARYGNCATRCRDLPALDGIPLAIELAAARARAIGVAEVAHRLDQRFGVLKAMRRGSDPRHRTMHDAISWSYDMLEPDEHALFTALSVFAGSVRPPLGRGDAPGGDALDLLTRLTERSMLAVRPRRAAHPLRAARDAPGIRTHPPRAMPGRLSCSPPTPSISPRRPERSRRSYVVPTRRDAIARAESSLADLRAAQRFALELGLSISRSVSSAHPRVRHAGDALRSLRVGGRGLPSPGALDHPLAPLLTGMRAYGAGCGGSSTSLSARGGDAPPRARSCRSSPSGLAERTLANVLYIVGDSKTGHAEALRQIELAEESGNRSRLVHACYMAAVATQLGR